VTRLLALVWPELRAPDADHRPFERMLDVLDDLSPRIEAVDLGVALVDVTGLEPLWGRERRIAARAAMLARSVAPLHVRCGIGDNRWLASLAARLAHPDRPEAPAAFRILERDELAGLPLSLLPADTATRQRLALFGLVEMRQLAELPRSAVGAQFGSAGERLQALARGHDPRPLVPRRRPARVEAAEIFDPPLDGIGAVGLTLRRLAADLCDVLRQRHRAPGRAVLTLRLEDAPALRVAQPFPQPALEPDWIARLLLSRVEAAARARRGRKSPDDNHTDVRRAIWGEEGVKSASNLGISMSRADGDLVNPAALSPKVAISEVWQERHGTEGEEPPEPRVASVHLALDRLADPASSQLPAFEARAGRWEELRWSLERIRHRFGEGRLWRASVDRPHAALPEDRWRLVELHE
jgi:nucleotidyltransferase/DNA polymerase involved in DNA repair